MHNLFVILLGLYITFWYLFRAVGQAIKGEDANSNAFDWSREIVRRIHQEMFNIKIDVINNCGEPSTGRVIVFGNHPDTISLIAWVGELFQQFPRRRFAPTARAGLIIGWGIVAIGGLVFNRDGGAKAITHIVQWLQQLGENTIITYFPDGRRGFPERIATEGRKILKKWRRLDLVSLYRYTMPASRGGIAQLAQSVGRDTTWVRCTISLDRAFPRIWQIDQLRGARIVIQLDVVEPPPIMDGSVDDWLVQHFGFINKRIGEIRGETTQ
jgi:hypothetical protein